MGYQVAVDAVVAVHGAFLAYVVFGGFLTWRWPRSILLHVPVALYGLLIITIGWTCPLTVLEDRLRRAGGLPRHHDGFIDHYLTGTIYPASWKTGVEFGAAVLVVIAYAGWWVRQRRRGGVSLRRRASA